MGYNDDLAELVSGMVVKTVYDMGLLGAAVPIGISARHVHLTEEHIRILFGSDYELTQFKALSQPGQFAANEKVEVIGPKGSVKNVRVLGPMRTQSQVELALSDTRSLGISAVVRSSGDLAGTPPVVLKTERGEVRLNQGVIVPERHIHMTPRDAEKFQVSDGQSVGIEITGPKGGIMQNVIIRVSSSYVLDCHIDTDDANAFQISQGQMAKLIVR